MAWSTEGRTLPGHRHPLWMEALRELDAPATVWRLHYNMPPTDPRYLDADDDVVLQDLLVLRARHLRMQPDEDRAEEDMKRLSEDPEVNRDMVDRTRAWVSDARFKRTIARLMGVGYEETRPATEVHLRRRNKPHG